MRWRPTRPPALTRRCGTRPSSPSRRRPTRPLVPLRRHLMRPSAPSRCRPTRQSASSEAGSSGACRRWRRRGWAIGATSSRPRRTARRARCRPPSPWASTRTRGRCAASPRRWTSSPSSSRTSARRGWNCWPRCGRCVPRPTVLRISQDRVAEKAFLNAAGVAHRAVAARSRAARRWRTRWPRWACRRSSRPRGCGYDGKGQALLRAPDELDAAWDVLQPKPLILEGFVDFACEISVIVARGWTGGRWRSTRWRTGTATASWTSPWRRPASRPPSPRARRRWRCTVAGALDLVGLLAVEMFVAADGSVLVNELAPRPHNSGHWTIDACPASQFELHVRAIAGLPLPAAVRHSDAAMKNLVGPEEWRCGRPSWPRPGWCRTSTARRRRGRGARWGT